MQTRNMLLLLLLAVHLTCAQVFPPQVSQSFSSVATVDIPFVGKVTGPYYYDFANQRDRMKKNL